MSYYKKVYNKNLRKNNYLIILTKYPFWSLKAVKKKDFDDIYWEKRAEWNENVKKSLADDERMNRGQRDEENQRKGGKVVMSLKAKY